MPKASIPDANVRSTRLHFIKSLANRLTLAQEAETRSVALSVALINTLNACELEDGFKLDDWILFIGAVTGLNGYEILAVLNEEDYSKNFYFHGHSHSYGVGRFLELKDQYLPRLGE